MKVQDIGLDEQLQQLAVKAQQYPAMTMERQQVLVQLVQVILKSGRLCRPYKGQFEGVYEEIYAEAKQELFLYICQKIEAYNPEKSPVMRWVNFLLEKRFFVEAISKVMDKKGIKRTLEDLENLIDYEEEVSLADLLKECISNDPDGLFKAEHVENYPEANFQSVALRLLAGKRWKEISQELGVKIPTLNGFYRRCLKKFANYLREYCRTQGN